MDGGLFCHSHGKHILQNIIIKEAARFYGVVDTGEVLVDNAACAYVEVPYFGIAHLAFRQTDSPVMGQQGRKGITALPVVHIRSFGHMYGIGLSQRACSPAIKDSQ
jgi:hypothetical protein